MSSEETHIDVETKSEMLTRRNQEQLILRADLASRATRGALKATGLPAIEKRRRVEGPGGAAMWFSPDEALLFVENAKESQAKMTKKLPAQHLIHDASGARVVFALHGAHLRDVIAKGAPRDLQSVEIGEVVRTRLGQVAVAFWFLDETHLELVCFRSVADYVEDWLKMALRPDGLPILAV